MPLESQHLMPTVPRWARMPSAAEVAKRRPQRVTITLPWGTHERLLERSGYEGRSLSNLCAHLLELGA